jgi:hypothetical protein
LGRKYHNEILFRSYALYRYYLNSLFEKKQSLSIYDVDKFTELFPAKKFLSIKDLPIDLEFLNLINERGLIGYIMLKLQNLRGELSTSRDSYEKQLSDLRWMYNTEREEMASIKRSGKRFIKNIIRKLKKGERGPLD